MLFKWIDYCEKYEYEIESWMNDDDTCRFATDNIKEDHEYWSSELNGDEYFCKVVLEESEIIAIILIMRSDEHPVHINPLIVNPKHRNKGYGTKIITELISSVKDVTGFDSDVFTADIFPNNKVSIKAFEKVGFVLAGIHKDGDCGYWVYPASELENYRKRCAADPADYFVISSTLIHT